MPDQGELQLTAPGFKPWRRVEKPRGLTCARDPNSGPGTCPLWWESCPDPERRNCYARWHERLTDEERNLLGYLKLLRWWAKCASRSS
jgi:hypothetical protein